MITAVAFHEILFSFTKMSATNVRSINIGAVCKTIVLSGLVLFIFYSFFFFNSEEFSDQLLRSEVIQRAINVVKTDNVSSIIETTDSPTNLSHIGFVVMSSLKSWNARKAYIEAWWRPNVTRGYLFLEKHPTQELLPWLPTSPPLRINEDVTKLGANPRARNQIRMFRSILDMYRNIGELEGLRWIVMADDDTLLMVDNLVEVLSKYDHNKYVYIGTNSECVKSNFDFSFDMGYGGASYALSYPLFEALSSQVDACIARYADIIRAASNMAQTCIADMGISLTFEKGLHQIDLHGDVSGLLSAHPQSPFISLHHFETIDPLFPSMDRAAAVQHLMKAAEYDQSRMMQQTICYHRESNWSFSVSWGYSTQIYENIIPRSILRKPLETFRPWLSNARPPLYMFNTRRLNHNPCEVPHPFFFKSISYTSEDQVLTTYARAFPRRLPPCSISGNHSADFISEIRVLSPALVPKSAGVIECCNVNHKSDTSVTEIKLRSCSKDEVIA